MELVIVEDYAALSRPGRRRAGRVIAAKPDAAVVLATGNTPMGMYQELAARYRRGRDSTRRRLRVFQLDAYLGLTPDDPRSLYGWLERAFLEPLGIPPAQVVALPGDARRPGGRLPGL